MSVNLHLRIQVASFDPHHAEAVAEAVKQLLASEGLAGDFGPVRRTDDPQGAPLLTFRSDPRYPVIISRSYVWIPQFTRQLQAAVTAVAGPSATVRLDQEDTDDLEAREAPLPW